MLGLSDRVVGFVTTWSDVSVGHSGEGVGLVSYQVIYKGNYHSLGEWRHLVNYQVAQSRTGGHSDMIVGLVLTGSNVSACLFKHNCWIGSSYVSNVSADPFFDHWLIRYKC